MAPNHPRAARKPKPSRTAQQATDSEQDLSRDQILGPSESPSMPRARAEDLKTEAASTGQPTKDPSEERQSEIERYREKQELRWSACRHCLSVFFCQAHLFAKANLMPGMDQKPGSYCVSCNSIDNLCKKFRILLSQTKGIADRSRQQKTLQRPAASWNANEQKCQLCSPTKFNPGG